MAIQSQPSRIPEPFAGSGTKNVIPATNAAPSASQAASWASGFPPECSQPISAGGCPVPRNDMNGALNQISQDFAFRQDGGIWAWSALADYDTQRVVRGSDGLLYWSVQPSGPELASGAVDPTSDDGTYWASPSVKTMASTDASDAAASTAWVNQWATSVLQSPSSVYVDAVNGDDSNDGLTAATAKKTISAAYSLLSAPGKLSSGYPNVYLAAGTYSDNIISTPLNSDVMVTGPSSGSPAIVPGILVYNNQTLRIGGSIQCTGSVQVSRSGVLRMENGLNLSFHNWSGAQSIYVYSGGCIYVADGSSVAISYTGTCSATNATVRATYGAKFVSFGTITFSGSVTGQRYRLIHMALVAGMGGPSAIPGTVAGTADSTSEYV